MSEKQSQQAGLLSLLRRNSLNSVSVIGMAKNVGKTVTFNYLVEQAVRQGLLLGLTSIGRDGEKRDEVFHTPKPRIFAPAGSLVGTARASLARSEAEVEVLAETEFSTAMGRVIIGRVRESGLMELAGPTLVSEHRRLQADFARFGVEFILTDGALDRVSPADPALANGIILATGAALGSGMAAVLDKTKDRLDRLSIPQAAEPLLTLCRRVIQTSKAALIDEQGDVSVLQLEHSLTAGETLRGAVTGRTKAVLLGGAVADGVLNGLLGSVKRGNDLCLVIKNGTCFFADQQLWRRFAEAGGTVRVVEPITVAAVTVNPCAPAGSNFAPHAFYEQAALALAPFPVADVVAGYGLSEREIS